MHSRSLVSVWFLLSLSSLPACARGTQVPAPARNIAVDSLLETLTVEEKVGQLIMPWLAGAYAPAGASELGPTRFAVDSLHVGGIIISVGSPLDVAAKLNALQRRSRLPLLVAADLEWGAGMRLTGATAFPMAMAVGATGREADAYAMGRVTAVEARTVGIHMTFSPVADVNNNPSNPIINTRSFGENPTDVGRLIAAYIRGAREHGLYTTAKHFPGHGDTGTDSHIDVPVIRSCWTRLDTLELIPFRAAVEARVTATMTAHVVLTCAQGDSLPATLSATIMRGMLRDSLGFEGLVVTDALMMGAIVNAYGVGESAVRAFLAGSDLLLIPADPFEAHRAMIRAVSSGRISGNRLDRSVRRILELKRGAGLFERRTVVLDSIPAVVGKPEFRQVADAIAQRALTLVQRGQLDAFRSARGRSALITYAEETNLEIGNVLRDELLELGETVTPFRLFPASGAASYDSARAVIRQHPRVVFAPSVRPIAWRGHVALPDQLADLILATASSKTTVLASFGSPYLLTQLPGFQGAYLLAWSDAPATERAVARALGSNAPVTGRLPITLSPALPRGAGIEIQP